MPSPGRGKFDEKGRSASDSVNDCRMLDPASSDPRGPMLRLCHNVSTLRPSRNFATSPGSGNRLNNPGRRHAA